MMIQKLTAAHTDQILAYAKVHERENLFVLGNFELGNPFDRADFWGYFQEEKLIALVTYFRTHKNFVVHTEDLDLLECLVKEPVKTGLEIECVAAFERFARPTVDFLKELNIKPEQEHESFVFQLKKEDFQGLECGDARPGTIADISVIADLGQVEASRVTPEREFLLFQEDQLVAKANIHGLSDHFFQIGGVITHEDHRRKGYGQKVVSKLCQHYFDQGQQEGLLFVLHDNVPAQKLYKKLGFLQTDNFLIANYAKN